MKASERTWVQNIDDIKDLTSIEGQQRLLTICQTALITGAASTHADVEAVKALLSSIKIKKDIDALQVTKEVTLKVIQLQRTVDELTQNRSGTLSANQDV